MQIQGLTSLKKWFNCCVVVALLSFATNVVIAADQPQSDGTDCTGQDGRNRPGFCGDTGPEGKPLPKQPETSNLSE
ncbi:MAG: hypothetical protein KBB94_07355 [Legionellaceae bacterium]|nr:hypothetical protein [Legionellaceae bacterium]MBP9775572.1 hypothetical protein [Legionellaceae bacterium]